MGHRRSYGYPPAAAAVQPQPRMEGHRPYAGRVPYRALGTVVGAFLAYYLLREPFGDAQGLCKGSLHDDRLLYRRRRKLCGNGFSVCCGDDLTAPATVADNLLMAAYFFVLIACAGPSLPKALFTSSHS